jgi:hypothetical protein
MINIWRYCERNDPPGVLIWSRSAWGRADSAWDDVTRDVNLGACAWAEGLPASSNKEN